MRARTHHPLVPASSYDATMNPSPRQRNDAAHETACCCAAVAGVTDLFELEKSWATSFRFRIAPVSWNGKAYGRRVRRVWGARVQRNSRARSVRGSTLYPMMKSVCFAALSSRHWTTITAFPICQDLDRECAHVARPDPGNSWARCSKSWADVSAVHDNDVFLPTNDHDAAFYHVANISGVQPSVR